MPVILDLGPTVKERAIKVGGLRPPLFWNYWPERLQVSLGNFRYGDIVIASTQPRTIASINVANGSSVQQTQQIQDSKKTTASFRLNVARGIRSGKQQNFSINIPKVGTLGGSATLETTLTETSETTKSIDQTWSWSISVPVPPRTRLEVAIVIQEALYRPNFDAVIRVEGEAGMRYKITADGQPIEKFWFIPIGKLFAQVPHPDITVVNESTITFAADGFVEGIEGVKYDVTTSEFPYPFTRDKDHVYDDLLPLESIVVYEDTGHLGPRVCSTCTGSGRCQNCGGLGQIRCSTCNGLGTLPQTCPQCKGAGTLNDGSVCTTCAGVGEIKRTCQSCSGTGNFECNQCRGSGVCKDCGGTGEIS